jgi:hypothetical protein
VPSSAIAAAAKDHRAFAAGAPVKDTVSDASGARAPYAVTSLLRAGPKWKFESVLLVVLAVGLRWPRFGRGGS